MYSTTSAGLDAGALREQLMGAVTVPGGAPGEDPEAVDALEQRKAAEEKRQQDQEAQQDAQ